MEVSSASPNMQCTSGARIVDVTRCRLARPTNSSANSPAYSLTPSTMTSSLPVLSTEMHVPQVGNLVRQQELKRCCKSVSR